MVLRNIALIALSVAVPAALMAQTAEAPPATQQGRPAYNPSTELTVNGTVKEVKPYTACSGCPAGTHLIVQTDQHGDMEVHLGPSSFLTSNNFQVQPGQQVQITGSQAGSNVLIARNVTANGKTLQLRSPDGTPLWSGAMAQAGPGAMMGGPQGGMGRMMGQGRMRGMMAPAYDTATEITVTGTVDNVQQVPFGTHVTLKTDNQGTLDVALGPLAYLTANRFQFAPGDRLKVIGSRAGANVLIARQAEANGKTLALRSNTGEPLWMGAGRGAGSAARTAPEGNPNCGNNPPSGNR